MKKFLTLFCLLFTLTAFGQLFPTEQFSIGSCTNVPAVLTAGATSNINCILFTSQGHSIDIFPRMVGTNATTSNIVTTVDFPTDATLTNWTTAHNLLLTNALNGTTGVKDRFVISAADCDGVPAVRVKQVQSFDATQTTTISGIDYIIRY